MKKLYSILSVLAVLSLFSSASAQLTSNNPYGISNMEWNLKYVNKTNILLETVDQESFINYVIISSGGAWSDMPYFSAYIKSTLQKQKEELCYKVGSGMITDVAQVKTYFSSLQKGHAVLFNEYKTKKATIIAQEDARKAAKSAGTGPLPSPLNCGSPCNNPGFELGTGFWDYWEGTACTAADPCSLIPGFSGSAHVLENVSGGFDPLVGPALPLVAPGAGNNSLMIGNGPVTGAGASRASISFTVDSTSTNFTYRYAVVLQDPVSGHTDPQRPYFKVKLRDASGAILPGCGDYEVIAKPPITGFTLVTGTTDIWYRPWTTVFVPLSAYIGQCVTLEFTSSDCSQSGHYGYAYIDADCYPNTLLTSSPAVCGGATVTLTAPAGGTTYTWTNTTSGGTTGIVGPSNQVTCVVDTGGVYQVVLTSVAGPSCNATLTITVLESPFNFFNSFIADTVCAGLPMTFLESSTPADSADAWVWDFTNDGLADSNVPNPTYTFAAGGTYPVTLISSFGPCNADTTINVLVLPGGIPVINSVPVMCSNGANITLVETGASGGVWAGPGVIDSIAGTFDPSVADTLTANTITYTTPGQCGAADTISITVLPSANPAWTTTAMCSDAGLTDLTTLLNGTTGGVWSGSGVTGNNFNPTGLSGPISVTYTVGTTPCVLTETHTIVVTPRANATITSALTLCSDDPAVTLAAVQTGGTWSGTGVTPGGVFNPSIGPGIYTVTYTIGGSCGDVDTAQVNVLLGGTPSWNLPTAICQYSDCLDLSTMITGSGGGTFTGPGVSGIMFCPDTLSGPVNITYSVGVGVCASSTTLSILVDPIDAAFTASPTSGMDPLTVDFTNGSTNWSVLQWDLANGGGTTGVTNPTATYVGYGVYYVVLVATNANGCVDTARITINVEQVSYLTVPNVFTPNGDGKNDVWDAIFQDGLSSFHATIYDRWGLKMYEWSNPQQGWNGQSKNGSPAPDGSYYYIINAKGVDDKDYMLTGFIQLLREK